MAKTFSDLQCSIARTLDLIGDRWTPLVLRDVAMGISRFDAIQRDLGISRKVLTERLQHLVEADVVSRTPYQDHPPRHDYQLTEKGSDLAMVLVAMQTFGDKWTTGASGVPLQWRHLGCGEISSPVACCDHCGAQVGPGDAVPMRGPGFDEDTWPEMGRAIDRLSALLS
jgi:DNA-binding HxlR family transcriptional regulator